MKLPRIVVLVLVLIFAVSSVAIAAPAKPRPAKPPKIRVHVQGDVFCPAAALVFGNVVISASRCYVVYVLRDTRGTFLAFAAHDARIPPGQLVRLNTPAGAKLRGRIFYLVPLRTAVAVIPVNTMTLVAFRIEDFGPSLTLILTSAPTPNLSITFAVRF